MNVKIQVAAAVIERDGKIFIARRKKEDHLQGIWEFPGGKVEEGESLQECLKRELLEELGIVADIAEQIYSCQFNHKGTLLALSFFNVRTYHGEITLYDHSAMAWVGPDEFSNYSFPEPDRPLLELLRDRMMR
jgi:mutator protein MutT